MASSLQCNVVDLDEEDMTQFQALCKARGVFLKWFGHTQAVGFTSSHHNWEYMKEKHALPHSDEVMHGLFDMRLPLSLTEDDIPMIAEIAREAMLQVLDS